MKKILKKGTGFSLAEIIFALAIVGIVAAVSIPFVINDIHKKIYAAKLKSSYNELKSVVRSIMLDNKGSFVNVIYSSNDIMNLFCNKMDCIKKCYEWQDNGNCFTVDPSKWKNLQGDNGWVNFYGDSHSRFILSNGAQLSARIMSTNCTSSAFKKNGVNVQCAYIYIDINGFKSPNRMGRDIFGFYIARDGLYPHGMPGSHVYGYSTYCNGSGTNFENGNGCASRVLEEGAMNY